MATVESTIDAGVPVRVPPATGPQTRKPPGQRTLSRRPGQT
jgi:hypothetical protein